MKRSEYEKLLKYNKDVYLGFIDENESVVEKNKLEPEGIEECRAYLMERGYRLYVQRPGSIDDRFLQLACESISEGEALPLVIYCDEDEIENDKRIEPFFKPDFSPDTLKSFFYFGGALLINKELGIDSSEFENELTKELYLEIATAVLNLFSNKNGCYTSKNRVCHISEVLYHSKEARDYKYPERPENISGADAEDIKISAVILSKDNPEMLLDCIDSLKNGCDMPISCIVVDNGSSEENMRYIKEKLAKRDCIYQYHPMVFEYSTLCNIGARLANTEYLLFLNDDIKLYEMTKGFPSRLYKLARQKHAGAVGARLLYPLADNEETHRIQHVGISQMDCGPSHKLCTFMDDVVYDHGRNRGVWNVMAVTGACLMVQAKKYWEVNGFDESLKIAYTDVDLCLDLYDKGYFNIVDNDVSLLHFESVSRGRDSVDDRKADRLKNERNIFYSKHPWLLKEGDGFYNKNLTKNRLGYDADYQLPWEALKVTEPLKTDIKLQKDKGKRVLASVDSIIYKASLFEDEKPCYQVEGWCIAHKKSQFDMDIVLVVKDKDEKLQVIKAVNKPREDLQQVFSKEKNTCLSGFICLLDADKYDKESLVGVGFLHRSLFGKNICTYKAIE